MSSVTSYLAVWRAGLGSGAQWCEVGLSSDSFKAKDKGYFDQGLRLACFQIGPNGSCNGVWHPGNGAQYWSSGLSSDQFKAKDQGYFGQGLRLVDVSVRGGGFAGVWRAGQGNGAQHWASGLSTADFKSQDKGYFDQGLRLVCLRVHDDGSLCGVWRAGLGNGAQHWATGLSAEDFKTTDKGYFDQGLRLVDVEVHDGRFSGVWRAGLGSGPQWCSWGNDWEMITGQDRAYYDDGLRMVKIFPYPGGGDAACLNQVVMPTGSYNYGIAGTATHCQGLPGTGGTPAPTVYYRWPCLTHDGSVRLPRMSALEYAEAPPFTLPFSDTNVRMGGGWLYSPGDWHHALDFSHSGQSFEIKAAAAGKVIFSDWDPWSGNTIIISHDLGATKDAFRTIYMHLRNGPTHDADKSWNSSVPSLGEPRLSQFKSYLAQIGCPKGGPYHPKADFWGSDADKIDPNIVGKTVAAGAVIAHAGCTGPGGANSTSDSASYTWGGKVNTHLHIFFARRDPTDNNWYFFDPFGIYAPGGSCYPGLNQAITTPCARFPIAWKGKKAQYP